MKPTKLFLALAVVMLLGACAKENKVIEFPLVGAANTKMIVFEKVELTDTATVLTIRGFNQPNYWIRVAACTRLVVQGIECKLLDSRDIEIGKELFMPEDGDSCFTLLFEPLPKGAISFDFIEGEAEDDWRIYDIDLTGKCDANKPEGLPHELYREPKAEGAMPEYAYEIGDVTINVHLLGYREGCMKRMTLPVNTTFEGQRSVDVNIDPKTGEGSVTFRQHGTACSFVIVNGRGHEAFFFAPGETIDLYVNLARINQMARYNYQTPVENPLIKGCWTKGSRYDALNNLPPVDWNAPDSLNTYDYTEGVMDADEYVERLIDFYHDECDFIESTPCHPWQKIVTKNIALASCFGALERDHRKYVTSDNGDVLVPFKSEHYERIFSLVDTESPYLLLGRDVYRIVKNTRGLNFAKKSGQLYDIYITHNTVSKTVGYNIGIVGETLNENVHLSNPFFAKVCHDVEQQVDNGEKILRKLIEPYKGKFILLDVWGTWCGPCKAALANSQEEYERLNPYDIVYLYLANNSSEESWENVIKEYNVTGDNVVHYNLPAEQQTAIERFLGVNSYPTYKLIDRNGNILDVNADPRDLNALENLLKTMNGTKI